MTLSTTAVLPDRLTEGLKAEATDVARSKLDDSIDEAVKDIDAVRFEHLAVDGYDPHGPIAMQMAV